MDLKRETAILNLKKASLKLQKDKEVRVINYNKNPNKCKFCNIELEYHKKSNKFCSKKCSATFNNSRRLHSEGTKDKIKKSLQVKPRIFKCKNCEVKFNSKRTRSFCSISCSSKFRWTNTEFREIMVEISSKSALKRHKEGDTSFGWQTRDKFKPSYPESIAIRVLEGTDFKYERELKVGRYFIDFALLDFKIAIEIDGKQHSKPERKSSDLRKDRKLKEKGWIVYRIKWPEDNVISEINKILSSISSR